MLEEEGGMLIRARQLRESVEKERQSDYDG